MDALIATGVKPEQAKVMAHSLELFAESRFVTEQSLKNEIKGLENTLIKWMVGVALAVILLIFTLIQFRLEAVDQRLTAMDQRIEALDQRIEALDQRIEALDQRIVALEQSVSQTQSLVQKLIEIQLQGQKQ